ncbi:MAG TPA: FAD-dependent oxidoreductase [Candidatus Thioglobus sp.]|nr:FAD-dependent oxidoreductase [Candidatus Thioglobus sp.]
MKFPNRTDIVVIGAGPAGLAAACAASKHGAQVVLIDEQATPGGQIYRNVTNSGPQIRSILGDEYEYGTGLTSCTSRKQIKYCPKSTVIDIDNELNVTISNNNKLSQIKAGHIIIATGATERPVPIPGWTLPGVMTVGAIQILIKSSSLVPSEAILVGSGPLLYLTAVQLIAAGKPPKALIETQTIDNYFSALPHLARAVRNYKQLSKGIGLINLIRKEGVQRFSASKDINILGDTSAESITFSSGGVKHDINSDEIFLHQGIIPSIQISKLLKLKHNWHPVQRYFYPDTDRYGVSSNNAISVVGDGGGIFGAKSAEFSGQISALKALQILGFINKEVLEESSEPFMIKRSKEESSRQFIDALYAPPSNILNPKDDAIVCRCEELTAQEIRRHIHLGSVEVNQIKAQSRCGMGNCQGRYCGTTLAEIIANDSDDNSGKVSYFNIRMPIKHVSLKELADLSAVK